jgi:hypothetical protein
MSFPSAPPEGTTQAFAKDSLVVDDEYDRRLF